MCESEAGCNVETNQQDGYRTEEVKGITPLGWFCFRQTLDLKVRQGAALP